MKRVLLLRFVTDNYIYQKKSDYLDALEIIEKMIDFYQGNLRDIEHFLKVWAYAKTIGEQEGAKDRIFKTPAECRLLESIFLKMPRKN